MKKNKIKRKQIKHYPATFPSISDFARRTPFSKSHLDFARKNGCDCIDSHQRINFRVFLEWLADQGDDLKFIDDNFEQKRLIRAKADALERQNMIESGQYVDRDEYVELVLQSVTAFKRRLFDFSTQHGFAAELDKMLADYDNLTPKEMLDDYKRAAEELRKKYSDRDREESERKFIEAGTAYQAAKKKEKLEEDRTPQVRSKWVGQRAPIFEQNTTEDQT